jgi:replication factor C subunit 2/4
MLFYGPPGTGKTSTVLALAKQLYGPEMIKSRVLELNASDERGISIVRDKVKNFARTQLIQPTAAYKQKYPCPPFKIIILDEADSMTQDAQSALRRTMETYSKITRFCLICNYVTRIIDPLASRCSKFRFKSLDEGNAKQRLEDIAKIEAVPLADGAVDSLISCSGGDLRKAITYLQSGCRIGVRPTKPGEDSMDTDPNPVTVAIVEDLAGVVPDRQMEGILQAIHHPAKGGSYQKISAETTELVLEGWSAGQVIVQVS